MLIKSSEFICSNTDFKKCPAPDRPEYALIGRSNVGKSSLTNMLMGRKDLAKTSARPGKTQLINHFLINAKWYLVDLPGYGWAKVSKDRKADFNKMTLEYLVNRENLQCLFVLIDSRLEPQVIDLDFIRWTAKNGIPIVIIFTKADKQSSRLVDKNIALFKNELLKDWEELPAIFISSAETGQGKKEILDFVAEINNNYLHASSLPN